MLGNIIKVPLREVWKHEANDFTPWLCENIDQLSSFIGIDLEVQDTEVSVGPFYADILAKDTGSERYVVIENQLEKTNHDHLGKCITYSAILDASIVIWIASEFTEEHQKAFDWLNDHTSENIFFYAIKVELIKIDESNPAINFLEISAPNNVVKQAVKRKESIKLTSSKLLQLKFWEEFHTLLKAENKITRLQSPRAQYWYDISLGKSGVRLSNTFNTNDNTIGVRVYISGNSCDKWLPYLEEQKINNIPT